MWKDVQRHLRCRLNSIILPEWQPAQPGWVVWASKRTAQMVFDFPSGSCATCVYSGAPVQVDAYSAVQARVTAQGGTQCQTEKARHKLPQT